MPDWIDTKLLDRVASFAPVLLLIAAVLILLGILSLVGKQKRTATTRLLQSRDKNIREETYQKASKSIEKTVLPELMKLGSIVIEIIHDTDWDEYFREEARRNISFDEVFEAIRRLNAAPKANVILVLHTLGGYSLPSIMLADAIRKHRKRGGTVTAFVPYVAMSGGTILALASDRVWMNPIARLGPIDTQFGEFSGDALRRLPDHKPAEKQSDGVILYRIEASKYEAYYETELSRLIDKDDVDPCVYDGSLSHSHAFNRDDAIKYGIRAIPNGKAKLSKALNDTAVLATKLVDERLSMIKNHYQKSEPVEESQKSDIKNAKSKVPASPDDAQASQKLPAYA